MQQLKLKPSQKTSQKNTAKRQRILQIKLALNHSGLAKAALTPQAAFELVQLLKQVG